MTGTQRRLRDALVVLALALGLLLGLEAGVRAFAAPPGDLPRLGPKAPGGFRLVALGGSTTLGVPDGTLGFVARLERFLRRVAPGRPLEVVNLARSGAGSRTVLATLEHALDADPPDLVVVLMGHNEFLEPRPTGLQRLRDRSRLAGWVAARIERTRGDPDPYPERLWPVDDAERTLRREGFLRNLDAVVAATGSSGVPLFLLTAPSNLIDWPPAWRRVEGALGENRVTDFRELMTSRGPESALAFTRFHQSERPDDPMLAYLQGQALRELGHFEEARGPLLRARELDPVPRRAFDAFNQAMRERAGGHVRVIDAAARLAEAADAPGLTGFSLIADNCHPTPRGNAIIAREIALALRDEGLFLSREARVPDAAGFDRGADLASDPRRHVRWLLSNAIYSMKTPFFHFEASRRYLEQARRLAPRDWRVEANLATLALLDGDLANGRRALARARAFKGAPLDPEDRELTPYLKEALARLPDGGGS